MIHIDDKRKRVIDESGGNKNNSTKTPRVFNIH